MRYLLFLLFPLFLLADGTLNLFIFNNGEPYGGLEIEIDGKKRYKTDKKGSLKFLELDRGNHFAVIYKDGEAISTLKFKIATEENTQIILRLKDDEVSKIDMEEPEGVEEDFLSKKLEKEKLGTGTLSGFVTSSETGKGIGKVKIFVKGYPRDTSTNSDGSYSLQLPEGNYSISLIHTEFSSQNVNGIGIEINKTTKRDIELSPSSLELAEFKVIAPQLEGSISATIDEKRNTSAVADVLGSEQFSKSGDSDAAGALKRASGITVVGGKYVFVRGLGERYSNTLMNNLNLSSPEPTRRVVPLDLFPTGVIESMIIQKTFSPDIPATFGGGTIQIRTKNIPDDFFMKASFSTKYIEGTTFGEGKSYSGGSYDFLGFDDGDRDLDGTLLSETDGKRLIYKTKDEKRELGKSTIRDSETEDITLYPPISGSLTVGDKFSLDKYDATLGYISSITYGHEYDETTITRNFYNGVDGKLIYSNGGDFVTTNRDIKLAFLLGLGLNIGENHKLRTTTFYINKSNDITQIQNYTDENKIPREKTYLSWVERNLLINQIQGEHNFDTLDFLWYYGNSKAERTEPSTIEYYYTQDEDSGIYAFSPIGSNYKYTHNILEDDTDNLKFDLKFPVDIFGTDEKSEIKVGYELLKKERDSKTRMFSFSFAPTFRKEEDLTLGINSLINQENLADNKIRFEDIFTTSDFYTASQDLNAFYAMTNLVFSDNLSLMIGARMEDSTQEVTSSGEKTEIVSDEVLPALTATYKIGEDMQIRAGYGKTVSRPDFREFATIRYQDPENADSVMGNSDLTYTTIQNFDLRWEWYMSAVETFSVALFSKYFENPIETTLTASDTPVTTFKNAKEATLYGAEIDFRKNLEFLNPKLELFSLSGNLALIESEVKIREEDLSVLTTNNREMQGQSPYVINMQLSYDDVDDGTSLNLAYNRFGERIRRLGQQKQADHYEQPFDQVDFVAQKSLDEAWKLKFKIGNLLDDKVVWKQDGEVTREYKKGRSYSFGFDWKY